ncbi:RNA polymerase sigma factor [Lysobacter sp. CA199]|uniref:RNA polymerase sigma factor n=1 Tax=Lysobacter sp. CA199 TaxID=3455608 RepID=UPI003F8D7D7F
MQTALDAWFASEILVHEQALVHYLRRCWPRADEVHDLRQEVYVRVYEAAGHARPHQPKSFLFATARHLMTDRQRRERVVSIEPVGDFESLNVLIDEVSPERRLSARQNLRRLADAFDCLPERCREVVWLRRVEELSQKQVAQRMGITEKTVEKQIAKGMRLLAEHYYGGEQALRGGDEDVAPDARPAQSHGAVPAQDDRNREHGGKQTD